jgi:hypothetical protein
MVGEGHKVHKYKEYRSVCPLVGIGDSPNPSLASECGTVCPSPRTGGGPHSPAGEGLGESLFRRLETSLALCLLCRGWRGGGVLRSFCNIFRIFNLANGRRSMLIFHFFPSAKEERRIGRFILEGTHLSFFKGTVSRDGLTKNRFRLA